MTFSQKKPLFDEKITKLDFYKISNVGTQYNTASIRQTDLREFFVEIIFTKLKKKLKFKDSHCILELNTSNISKPREFQG